MFSKLAVLSAARCVPFATCSTSVGASALLCAQRFCSGSTSTPNNTTYRSGIIQAVRDLAKEQADAKANGDESSEAVQRTLNAAAEEVLRRQRESTPPPMRSIKGTPAHASDDATRAADEKGDFDMPIRGEDVAANHGHSFRDQRPTDPNETIENKRRRLTYQSRYRGMVEMDLIFGHFARCKLDTLPAEQLDEYDTLLKQLDNELFRWLVMEQPAPEPIETLTCFQALRTFVAQEREQLLGHY